MQIITVELLNDRALTLLQQLEQLDILRLVTKKEVEPTIKKRRWAGSISKATGEQMLNHVEQSRKQWERNI